MRILITAGNTQTPIDQVRCITNIFTGRTGAHLAVHAHGRGHDVSLLTSHPEAVTTVTDAPPSSGPRWQVRTYRTYEDLHNLMAAALTAAKPSPYDAVIHAAAVSDFRVAGVFARPGAGREWNEPLVDILAGKVKSTLPEVWLKLVPTAKLVDLIRTPWGFAGVLVKFKLEVGVSDSELLATADASRRQSDADLLVANTLEGMTAWAYIVEADGTSRKVPRAALSAALVDAVEAVHRQKVAGA